MPLFVLTITAGAALIVLLAIGRNTALSWVLRLFTPTPAVQLPRLVLTPDADEQVRTNLPGQAARL
ncbi:hypothetical protein [Streptomyces sp. NPDC003737]|uniref:hypothetical protein n=1 Tax=Streptomyces sp. NPDC003737 TaxID=3364685 RepID=UPI00368B6906